MCFICTLAKLTIPAVTTGRVQGKKCRAQAVRKSWGYTSCSETNNYFTTLPLNFAIEKESILLLKKRKSA